MLKIEDLTFTYFAQQQPSLKDVNLHVSPGKLALVTGPSGSGKSTLLHCINGLAVKHYGGRAEGHIWVAGREVVDKPLWQTSELAGTIFQNPNTQFFQLNVEDEIAFGLEHAHYLPEVIDQKITRSLADVGIPQLRYRDLFTLSSGEKQKVALASVLAMEQPLLLMDEPTANLDIASIHELKAILQTLKRQGRTILISEHRLWYLRDLADQVIVVNDGGILYSGSPQILESASFRRENGLRIWDEVPNDSLQIPEVSTSGACPVLETIDLSGGTALCRDIVKDVNLSLVKGECLAVMGHNGAGKTMLLRMIAGLQKKIRGSVRLDGTSVKPKNRLGRIACVTQQADQQLFSDSVLGELQLAFSEDDSMAETAEALLQRLDLWGLRDRHPQTLSGGEKQRLAIAASLMMDLNMIIFDEPTSGMDNKRMQQLAAEIRTLCDQGLLVIVITHDVELVSLACSRLVWMEAGRICKTLARDQFTVFFEQLIKNDSRERCPV